MILFMWSSKTWNDVLFEYIKLCDKILKKNRRLKDVIGWWF